MWVEGPTFAYEAIPETERQTGYERADRALEAAGMPEWMRTGNDGVVAAYAEGKANPAAPPSSSGGKPSGEHIIAVAYDIETEEEIEDLEMSVDGKSIAHADLDKLDVIYKKLKVKPLMEFLSADTEDIADFLEDADDDVSALPEEAWFFAAEGLHSVDALLDYLREHEGEVERQQDMIEDLESYQCILNALAERNVRWHLLIDI